MVYVSALRRGLGISLLWGLVGCSSTSNADGGGTEASTSTSTSSDVDAGSSEGDTTTGEDTGTDEGTTGEPPGPSEAGEFKFLTYNVAGLPEGLSSGDPVPHMPQISPLLNNYDLVVVQEDFYYHEALSGEADHPHQSTPWTDMPSLKDIGDGLNRFSAFPFEAHERVGWGDCNGTVDCASDCLATKGWSYARHTIVEGFELDVYNLHHEAGGCDEDVLIREQATEDLIVAVNERSAGRAVIIAGDYNLHGDDPVDLAVLEHMAEELGLEDACWALDCGSNSIDRVFYRSSSNVELSATDWSQPAEFVDSEDGGPLSDHLPTAVVIHYAPTAP